MTRHNLIRGCSRVLNEGAQTLAAQTGIAAGLFRYEESSYVYWLGGCERCGFLDVDAVNLMRSMGEKNAEAELAARVQVLLERLERMCYGRCDHFVSFLNLNLGMPFGPVPHLLQPRVITRAQGALSPFTGVGRLSATVEGVWLVPDLTLEDVAKELGVTVDRIRAALAAAGLTVSEQQTFLATALDRERRKRDRQTAQEVAGSLAGPRALMESYQKLISGIMSGVMAGTRPGLTAGITSQEVLDVRTRVYREAWEAEFRALEEWQGRPLTTAEKEGVMNRYGLAWCWDNQRQCLPADVRLHILTVALGLESKAEMYRAAWAEEYERLAVRLGRPLTEAEKALALAHFGLAWAQNTRRRPPGACERARLVERIREQCRARERGKLKLEHLEETTMPLAGEPREMEFISKRAWAWSPHSDLPEPDDNLCRQVAEEVARAEVIIDDDPAVGTPEALRGRVTAVLEACGRRAEPTGLVRAILDAAQAVLGDGQPLGLAQAERNLAWLVGKGFDVEKIDGARLARLGRGIKGSTTAR